MSPSDWALGGVVAQKGRDRLGHKLSCWGEYETFPAVSGRALWCLSQSKKSEVETVNHPHIFNTGFNSAGPILWQVTWARLPLPKFQPEVIAAIARIERW